MAVGYRSGSSNSNDGTSTSLTIPVPSGTVAGDLLVAVTEQDSDGVIANLTAGTSGFTQLGTDGAEVGTSPAARCWYRVATGVETSFTFNIDGNATGAGAIACLTGANTTSPIDVTTSWSSGTGATETAPALTVAAGSALLCAFIDQGGTGHAHSQPGGMTEVADPASTWSGLALDVETRDAGSTGTRASTLTGTLGGNWRTVSFAVAAAPTTPYDHVSSPAVVRSANYAAIATVTTATFYPPAGSLLVALLSFQWADTHASTTLLANDSSGGGNWASVVHAESPGSRYAQSAIFTKYFAAAPGGITVTAGKTGTVACNISLAVRVVLNVATDQTACGTYGTYVVANGAAQQSITAAQSGSRIYMVASLDSNDTLTVNGASTTIDLWQNATINAVNALGRSTGLTAASGSQGPYGWTGATNSADTAIVLLEVLGAAGLIKTGGAAAHGKATSPRQVIALTRTGKAAPSGAGSGPKTVVAPPGIAAVNTLSGAEGVGLLGFTVSTTAIGNAIILGVRITSTTYSITSLSGGGCTWTLAGRYASTLRGRAYEVWIGQIISVGSNATVTASWSGDVSTKTITYNPQEFTNGGSPSTWTRDGAQTGGVETSSTSTTLTWPTLSAAAAGELYFGQGGVNTGTPSGSGTPAGFVFAATTGCWCYGKVSGSGSIAPTQSTSPAATFGAVAALLVATPSAATYTRAGGAAPTAVGTGSHAGSRWTETGGAAAPAVGVGARAGARAKSGGAVYTGAGTGFRSGTRAKTGAAARPAAGSGSEVITPGPRTGGAAPRGAGLGGKAGYKGPRAGGAVVGGGVGGGPVRISTDWCYAASAASLTPDWETPQAAVGESTGDFAVWVGSGEAPGAAGTLELAGFPAYEPLIPSVALPDTVVIKVRHAETPVDQVAGVSARVYVGNSPVGGAQPLTPLPYPHEDTITVTGLTYTDLTNLRVRIIVARV